MKTTNPILHPLPEMRFMDIEGRPFPVFPINVDGTPIPEIDGKEVLSFRQAQKRWDRSGQHLARLYLGLWGDDLPAEYRKQIRDILQREQRREEIKSALLLIRRLVSAELRKVAV